jgi:hypothetical protein
MSNLVMTIVYHVALVPCRSHLLYDYGSFV